MTCILCEIIVDGSEKMVLCGGGYGDTIPDAAERAISSLIYCYDKEWLDHNFHALMWQFTKIYPEKKKWVPPLWEPSDRFLDMTAQGDADSFASLQV